MPPNIVLKTIDLRADGVSLRGIVRGTSDEASGLAQAYTIVTSCVPIRD